MQGMGLLEIIQVISGELVGEWDIQEFGLFDNPIGASIDSRTVKKKNLFFAIKGENFDGHDFVWNAYQKKVFAAVVQKDWVDEQDEFPNLPLIAVEDTLQALQQLAQYYRKKFPIPVIAITGSNGKTTTKDMTAQLLSTKYNVLKTLGNFNNHIGLPLTLLRLNPQHQLVVVEMGMSAPREIDFLCKIADPEVGVITNVSPAHLEFFENIEEIAMAKAELIQYLSEDGIAILNADNQYVMGTRHLTEASVHTFGIKHAASHKVREYTLKANGGYHVVLDDEFQFELNIPGKHNLYNALAAISMANLFNIPHHDIREELAQFRPSDMRTEIVNIDGINIIKDCYNANPASVKASLDILKNIATSGKRIAVLGDMLELGEKADVLHQEIGEKVADLAIDRLITIGDLARYFALGADENGLPTEHIFSFDTTDDATNFIRSIIRRGDLLLVKGSRGIKMERIIQALEH